MTREAFDISTPWEATVEGNLSRGLVGVFTLVSNKVLGVQKAFWAGWTLMWTLRRIEMYLTVTTRSSQVSYICYYLWSETHFSSQLRSKVLSQSSYSQGKPPPGRGACRLCDCFRLVRSPGVYVSSRWACTVSSFTVVSVGFVLFAKVS